MVYRYQDLSLQGLTISNTDSLRAINDSAWIVGDFYNSSSSNYQPFVWRPGLGRTNLENPGYPMEAYGHGINNQGQIVGRAQCDGILTGVSSCYWSGPDATPEELIVFIVVAHVYLR